MTAVAHAGPLAPPHWTWRSGLEGRTTLRELDAFMDDRSSRMLAEETHRSGLRALSDENARLRAVLGHCPKCIAVLDEEGRLVGYNHEFRSLFERAPELGMPVTAHFAATDATMLESVIRSAGTSRKTAALVRLGPESSSGATARHVEFLVATLPWIDGGTIGVILAGDDRTPELAHQREVRSLHRDNGLGAFALAQSMVQQDVGAAQLTALTALRALAAIDGETTRLSDAVVRNHLDEALLALQQASAAIARAHVHIPREAEPRADVRTCAQRAARMVGAPHGPHAIYLDVTVPDELVVPLAPSELTQLLVNLLGNALIAVEDANRPGHVQLIAESQDGDCPRVLLRIVDDGVGIEPSRLVSVFDPYATTRPDRGAVGLGLAVSRRMVEAASGSLKLMSEIGRGTEVLVDLPRARG